MGSRRLRSIVTGGSGAVGQAILSAMVARGDAVACLDLVEPDDAAYPFVPLDVTQPDLVHRGVAEACRMLGGVDVLVNAAGVMRPAPFIEISEDEMHWHLNVNLMGAFRVAQECARLMSDADGGRIVFITSIHGQVGVPERAAYAAAKGGVASMARVMAAELAAKKIRVNVLAPGAIDGGMAPNPTTRQGWSAATPSNRVAHLDEVAKATVLLTSDDASFITGQVIPIDGGVSTSRVFG